MVFVTVHLASNLAANSLFLVLCLITLFADYFQFDAFTVQLTGLRHELRYEDVYITSWTSFSDFTSYGCTYSNNEKVRTACSNISYFRAAGVLYLLLITGVIGAVLLSMLSLYLRMLGKENLLSRMKLPHLIAAPGFCLAGATYLWVSNIDHLTHTDGTHEDVERMTGITLLFITAFVGILTLLHYLFLKHYRHIEDIGFSFKLFEEIQEKEDRIRDLERDQKDYVALVQDVGDLKNFLSTPGSPKPALRTLIANDTLRIILEMWMRQGPDDRSTVNASMAVESGDLGGRLSSRKLRLGSALSQSEKKPSSDDPEARLKEQTEAAERISKENEDLQDQVARLNKQLEDLETEKNRQTEEIEKERKGMKLEKKQKQKLRAGAPAGPHSEPLSDDLRDERIAMQRQEIDELTLIIESLRSKAASLSQARDEALRKNDALVAELSNAENTLSALRSDLDQLEGAKQSDTAEITAEKEKAQQAVDSLRAEIENSAQQLTASAQELSDLQRQISSLEDQKAQLAERLHMAIEELATLQDDCQRLRRELAQMQRDSDAASQENDDLKATLLKQGEELNTRLRDCEEMKERLKEMEEGGERDKGDREELRRKLEELEAIGRDRDGMGAEEVEAWKARVHQTTSSTSDQLSQRDQEIDRLSRLIVDLRIKHSADLDRQHALWTVRLEDAIGLADREHRKSALKDAEIREKERDWRRTEDALRDAGDRERREKEDVERENERLRNRLADTQGQLIEASRMAAEEATTWRIRGAEDKTKAKESALASDSEVKRLTDLVLSLNVKHTIDLENQRLIWMLRMEDAISLADRERNTAITLRGEVEKKDGEVRMNRREIEGLREEGERLRRELDRERRAKGDLEGQNAGLRRDLEDSRCQAREVGGMAGEETRTWRLLLLKDQLKARESANASDSELKRLTLLLDSLRSSHASDLESQREDFSLRLEDLYSWACREHSSLHTATAEAEMLRKQAENLCRDNETLAKRLSDNEAQQRLSNSEQCEQLKSEAETTRAELAENIRETTEKIEGLARTVSSLYDLIESLERSLMLANEQSQQGVHRSQAALSNEVANLQHTLEDTKKLLAKEKENRMNSDLAREKAEKEANSASAELKVLRLELKARLAETEELWRNRLGAVCADFQASVLRLASDHKESMKVLEATARQQAAEIGSLTDEKEALQQEVETLTYELDQARGDLSEVTVTYDESQARNLELQHGVAKLETRVNDFDQQRAEYQELINRLKQQIELTVQVHEGKMIAAAKDFEAERDDIIAEFSQERDSVQEEADRLKEELARVSEEKDRQDADLEWIGEEKEKLENKVIALEADVQHHLARQATMINWLGSVWEDKEATVRLKDELVDRYTKEIEYYKELLRKLQEEFDRYKKEQESWNKSLICGEEEKMSQYAKKLKDVEERLEAEQAKTLQLDKQLCEAKRQEEDLCQQLHNLRQDKDQLVEEVADKAHMNTVLDSLNAEIAAKAAEIADLHRMKADNSAKIAELTDELERLRAELDAQKAKTSHAESLLRDSQDKAMRIASQVTSLKEENKELDTKNKEQNAQVGELEQKILALQLEIQRVQQALARADREITSLKPWPQKAKQAESDLVAARHQLAMKSEELESVRTDLSLISSRNEELSSDNDKLRSDIAQANKEKAMISAALAAAQNDAVRLQRGKEEDDRRISELAEQNADLSDALKKLKARVAELEAALKTTAEENLSVKGKLKEANSDRDRARNQMGKMKADHQQALAAAQVAAKVMEGEKNAGIDEEREGRRRAEEDLADFRDKAEEWERLMNESQKELLDKDKVIADLEAKQSRYKKELARRKRVALLRILLKDWNKNLLLKNQKAVDHWHLQAAPKKLSKPKIPEIVISGENAELERFALLRLSSLEGELTDPEIKAGEAILQEEKNVLLRDNLIISTYKAAGLREAPLAFVNVFKFFEELMDKKYEVDQSDLMAFRRPRGMTEFMMEHLNRMFGLKNLAVKFLCQLLPALQTLYKQGHPYGSLFARMLQVFHKDPISFKLGLFLTRARVKFNELVEKMEKERSVQSSGRVLGRKKQNLTSQQMFELAASGGESFLSDVIYLVYDMFEQDRAYGELMLKLIKPAAIDVSDFIIFKICHKMAKLGLTPESLYDLIDVKREQNLLREEFIQGVQQTMDLWVDRTDLQTLFTIIDQNTSETVSRDEFALKINFDSYYFNAKNEYYVVSKSTFMNALTDVYNEMYRNHAARLRMVYMEVGRKEMNLTKFRQVVMSIDPSYDLSKIDQMYSEAMKAYGAGAKGLGMEGFCKILLQHGVGVMQLFETDKLEEAMERKSMGGGLDISLTSEGELVSLSSRRRSPVA